MSDTEERKTWKREYMKEYMRKKRGAKGGAFEIPKLPPEAMSKGPSKVLEGEIITVPFSGEAARAVPEIGLPVEWTSGLAAEVALNDKSIGDVLKKHGLDDKAWEAVRADLAFQGAVADLRKLSKANGGSFRLKAVVLAERLLPVMEKMVSDPLAPGSVRADMAKFVVKMAGLDASEDRRVSAGGAGLTINISLG